MSNRMVVSVSISLALVSAMKGALVFKSETSQVWSSSRTNWAKPSSISPWPASSASSLSLSSAEKSSRLNLFSLWLKDTLHEGKRVLKQC